MIVNHDLLIGETKALWESGGLAPGASTGWPSVDRFYTVGLGQWSLLTGFPGSGKSEWLDALMVNLSKRETWKFAIYSPENWPLKLHVAHIAEKYLGKPFNPGPTPRMNEEELDDALAWMQNKFFFAKPERPDLPSIFTEAAKLTSSSGAWKLGVVVDPWNQLDHSRPSGMYETEYVSQALSGIINWVREANCHLWLVAHPSKLQKDRDGKLPIPTPHDVSGSAHFWNKADNCICVHRNQSEGTQHVDIHVQKVRFRHMGHVGLASLDYDKVTGRYAEQLRAVAGYARQYADE
jgi:twinkle protein